jgi:carboxyl-terminal processing protease
MTRSSWNWVIVLSLAALVTWTAARSATPKDEDAELYRLFVDALEHVDRSYVKPVDRRKLIESAIGGMLEELDPYSNFIPPQEYKQFNRATTGKFGGVGIQVGPKRKSDAYLQVVSPLVGAPADEGRVLAGDRIFSVDGKPLEGMTQAEVVERLTGEPGTQVRITVQHRPYDSEPFEVDLTRAEINIETVMGDKHGDDDSWDFMIDKENKIGYVRVLSFTQRTADDLKAALQKLEAEGARGLILDLRNNPGGLLPAAVAVCDLFLDEGVIVGTKGRNTEDKRFTASPGQLLKNAPIAVLVNNASASASEIVSACLQDHKRAIVVGERTFGKGSVQNVIELDGGKSALKLTTAGYHRPSGKNIHKFPDSKEEDEWGVRPDEGFEVKLSNEEQQKYFLWRSQRDRALGKASEREKVRRREEEKAKQVETRPAPPDGVESKPAAAPAESGENPTDDAEIEDFKDPQMDKALEYIRARLGDAARKAA